MSEIKEVITLDETEASSEKKAQVFSNFSYTTEKGVDALIEVNSIKQKLTTDMGGVHQTIKKIERSYDKFTRYNSTLDYYLTKYKEIWMSVDKAIDSLVNIMEMSIKDFAAQDQSLQEDLQKLNDEIINASEYSENPNPGTNTNYVPISGTNVTDKGYPSSTDGYDPTASTSTNAPSQSSSNSDRPMWTPEAETKNHPKGEN